MFTTGGRSICHLASNFLRVIVVSSMNYIYVSFSCPDYVESLISIIIIIIFIIIIIIFIIIMFIISCKHHELDQFFLLPNSINKVDN